MIGIRPDFAGDEVPQGGTAKFSLIAVDPDGKREALKGAQWSLVKVERNYQWYRSNNSWNYEPVTFTKSIANGTIDLSADGEATVSHAGRLGPYRLEIETADPEGPATSYEFDAGWYVASTSTETPDGLEIALDKDNYAAGEVAKLKVSPHFAGELLVTIGADKLLKTVTATVPAGGSTVDIPVGDDWGAGAYVTATLFRPGDAQETRMPARAIGVKWLKVDPGSKKLAVTLTPPDKTDAAPAAVDPGLGGRRAAGQQRLCHGRRRRCRHPQPDQLQGAGSGGLVLRPAHARARNARHLRPPDRRLARRHRQAAHRRRRRQHAAARQPADRKAGRLLLRPGPARRRRQGDGSTSTSRSSTAPCASWPSPGPRKPSAMPRRTSSCAIRW